MAAAATSNSLKLSAFLATAISFQTVVLADDHHHHAKKLVRKRLVSNLVPDLVNKVSDTVGDVTKSVGKTVGDVGEVVKDVGHVVANVLDPARVAFPSPTNSSPSTPISTPPANGGNGGSNPPHSGGGGGGGGSNPPSNGGGSNPPSNGGSNPPSNGGGSNPPTNGGGSNPPNNGGGSGSDPSNGGSNPGNGGGSPGTGGGGSSGGGNGGSTGGDGSSEGSIGGGQPVNGGTDGTSGNGVIVGGAGNGNVGGISNHNKGVVLSSSNFADSAESDVNNASGSSSNVANGNAGNAASPSIANGVVAASSPASQPSQVGSFLNPSTSSTITSSTPTNNAAGSTGHSSPTKIVVPVVIVLSLLFVGFIVVLIRRKNRAARAAIRLSGHNFEPMQPQMFPDTRRGSEESFTAGRPASSFSMVNGAPVMSEFNRQDPFANPVGFEPYRDEDPFADDQRQFNVSRKPAPPVHDPRASFLESTESHSSHEAYDSATSDGIHHRQLYYDGSARAGYSSQASHGMDMAGANLTLGSTAFTPYPRVSRTISRASSQLSSEEVHQRNSVASEAAEDPFSDHQYRADQQVQLPPNALMQHPVANSSRWSG